MPQSILRDSVEADSGQNFDDGARSPRWPSKKHKNLEHSACKWQRLQNRGNDCENRERHRAAGKKAVEKALPGEGGVRMFCSENRCVGGRDRPSAVTPTNAGQTSAKSRRQHVQNRLYPGLLRMVDRNALVAHLLANGFKMQGSGIPSDKGTILDNTSSMGDHVCTWLHEARTAASFVQIAPRKPFGWGGAATQKLGGCRG